jgi:hypothetical protein
VPVRHPGHVRVRLPRPRPRQHPRPRRPPRRPPPGGSTGTGTPAGSVPATLWFDLGPTANLGAFLPGIGRDYEATVGATVTSTAGDATLTVADPSPNATGRLVNGTYSLAQPLMARANQGAFAPITGTNTLLTLLTYAAPVSANPATIGLKQTIGANESLRRGAYTKTLTFTLSTTTP